MSPGLFELHFENPLFAREMRRWLRQRGTAAVPFFIVCGMTLLLFYLVIDARVSIRDYELSWSGGRNLRENCLVVYLSWLGLQSVFAAIIPGITIFLMLRREVKEQTMRLLLMTELTPAGVVWGLLMLATCHAAIQIVMALPVAAVLATLSGISAGQVFSHTVLLLSSAFFFASLVVALVVNPMFWTKMGMAETARERARVLFNPLLASLAWILVIVLVYHRIDNGQPLVSSASAPAIPRDASEQRIENLSLCVGLAVPTYVALLTLLGALSHLVARFAKSRMRLLEFQRRPAGREVRWVFTLLIVSVVFVMALWGGVSAINLPRICVTFASLIPGLAIVLDALIVPFIQHNTGLTFTVAPMWLASLSWIVLGAMLALQPMDSLRRLMSQPQLLEFAEAHLAKRALLRRTTVERKVKKRHLVYWRQFENPILNRAMSEALAYTTGGGMSVAAAAAVAFCITGFSTVVAGLSKGGGDALAMLFMWVSLFLLFNCVFLPLRVCADWKTEADSGTLLLLRSSPLSRWEILYGKSLVPLLTGALTLLCGVAPACLVSALSGSLATAQALLLLLWCATTVALAVSFATFAALYVDSAITSVMTALLGVGVYALLSIGLIDFSGTVATPTSPSQALRCEPAVALAVVVFGFVMCHFAFRLARHKIR